MDIISKLVGAGEVSDMTLVRKSRIRVVNVSAYLAAVNIICYCMGYYLFAPGLAVYMISVPLLCALGLMLFVPFSNRHNRHILAGHILLILSMISVFYVPYYFVGPQFMFQAYFVVFAFYSFVVFPYEKWVLRFIYAGINFLLYVYISEFDYPYIISEAHSYHNDFVARNFSYSNLIISFLTMFMIMWLFDYIINKEERALVVALDKSNYLANYDYLTGLVNRRSMSTLIQKAIASANEDDKHLSLLMFDIDDFKKINDSYGHQMGDDVLRGLCFNTTQILEENVVMSRWGGEEFLILMDGYALDEGLLVAEKVRSLIESTSFLPDKNITISVGVTQMIEGDTLSSIVCRADHLMYSAKQNGKNRICGDN